jgi:hypothetical protein
MLGKRGAVMTFVVLAAVSTACSGGRGATVAPTGKAPSPNPVSTAEFEADKKLIIELWRGLSDAWGDGQTPEQIDAGFERIVETTYPGSGLTVASCKANVLIDPSIEITQFKARETVDQSTIERDDGWKVPGGTLDGIVPTGRLYTMRVHVILTVNNISEVNEDEVHVAIDGGRAYHFPGCL